ncbi:MAG: T9SS type A sorting domain-containing protein [Sphingobacteriaceae bacterium]|nr:T9SS type A sorting domain-containing protein [Sphingobacteriaceae bacterium]
MFTLPQTAGSTTYIYQFVGDNTLTFDSNNHLVYNVSSNTFPSSIYKQFVKRYNGTNESIVGDTILYNTGYTSYGAKIYANSANELFAFFHKATSNNVVMKKFNGANWINFGDTLNFRKNLAQSCIAFTSNNSFIISGTGQGRSIYNCNSQTSGFQLIDTLNVSGIMNFAQITDLSINPVNNDIYATFNSFPTSIQDYSVMNHGALTTGINNQYVDLINVALYPNPGKGVFTVQANFESTFDVMVYNNIGQLVKEAKELKGVNQIDMSGYAQGIYNVVLRVNDNYKTIKMVIE